MKTEMITLDDLIGPLEASQILGLSQQRITGLLRDGKLPGRRVGRQWVIDRQAVENYQNAQLGNVPTGQVRPELMGQ